MPVCPAGTVTVVPLVRTVKPAGRVGNVRLKVSWTKDQLQAAPDFQYYKPPPATTGIGPTNGLGKSSPMTPRPQ